MLSAGQPLPEPGPAPEPQPLHLPIAEFELDLLPRISLEPMRVGRMSLPAEMLKG